MINDSINKSITNWSNDLMSNVAFFLEVKSDKWSITSIVKYDDYMSKDQMNFGD